MAVDKRRMCPNCRAFISSDDKACPYCEAEMGARAVETRPSQDSMGGVHFTTSVILLLNVGLYIAPAVYSMKGPNGSLLDIDAVTLAFFGAKLRSQIFAGQWWRLVTAGFLHGGLIHILINSWSLFGLGALVEETYGTYRFLVFYFAGTVAGFAASTYWSNSLSVGASAGICGLIGAMVAVGFKEPETRIGALVRTQYVQWIVWIVVIGFMGRVDNAAHFGGFVAGFLAGYLSGTPRVAQTGSENLWKVLAAVCILITAYSFAMMFLNFTLVYQHLGA